MDLTGSTRFPRPGTRSAIWRAALLALVVAIALWGCSPDDYTVGDDSLVIPASLLDAYPVALARARDWSTDVFVQSAGGGFSVMDEHGVGRDHSYQFHSRRQLKNLTVHLLGGIPWTQEETDPIPPPPLFVNFVPYVQLLDSKDVVPQAVQEAGRINAAHPDSIPIVTQYAARLLSIAVWPEAQYVGDPTPNTQAWRVDFLVQQLFGGGTSYFSAARAYIHPVSGEMLGWVVPDQPELYPFP
ncbi:MAG TPA: hypothetical protein VFR10_13140, partial [bacterium]|nr:hypothetical protein [bacterium]